MDDDALAPGTQGHGAESLHQELLAAIHGLTSRIDAMEDRLSAASPAVLEVDPGASEDVPDEPDLSFLDQPVAVLTPGEAIKAAMEDAPPLQMVEGEDGVGAMTADEIEALFAQAGALMPLPPGNDHQPQPTPDDSELTEEKAVEAILALGMQGVEEPKSAVPMSDAEVASLVAEAEAAEQLKAEELSQLGEEGLQPEGPEEEAKEPVWQLDFSLAGKIPLELATAALAAPLQLLPGKLVCLISEPCDYEALGRLSKAAGVLIETKDGNLEDVLSLLRQLYKEENQKRQVKACSAMVNNLLTKWRAA